MSDPKPRLRMWILAILGGAVVGAWLAPSSPERKSPAEVFAAFTRLGFTPAIFVSLGLWLILSIYWEVAGRSETTQKEPFGTRLVHLVLTSAAQILVIFPVPFLRQRFLPLSTALLAVGFVIEVLGLGIALWSRRVLGRHWSGAIASNVDHELIETGPYRRVRHPIYTGVLLLYVGTALVSGEVHALVGLALAFIAYARKIRMEEEHLVAHFGPAYEAYRQRTASLVPRIL